MKKEETRRKGFVKVNISLPKLKRINLKIELNFLEYKIKIERDSKYERTRDIKEWLRKSNSNVCLIGVYKKATEKHEGMEILTEIIKKKLSQNVTL